MSDAFVIEISGRTAGIVARDHAAQRFHFFAASHFFNAPEKRAFRSPGEAERAAREHLAAKSARDASIPEPTK